MGQELESLQINEIQKIVLRLYARNESLSLRDIAKVITRPNKTMLGRWVAQFEQNGLIIRIGNRRSMKVFLTDAGRKAMR